MKLGDKTGDITTNKGSLLGEFAQFAVPASDMSPEEKKTLEGRFKKNKLSAAVAEVLKHRDLQMLTVEERLRFERKNDFKPS